jgi:16S rRNA (guanine1207-N2)-methyltransferase
VSTGPPVSAAEDAVDQILLSEVRNRRPQPSGPVVVIDDDSGALIRGLARMGIPTPSLRRYNDSLVAEREVDGELYRLRIALPAAAALDPELFADAQLVALRLPKSLAALDEIVAAVAATAAPDVLLLAGGRTRHMTRSMNDVLGRWFTSVSASLGQQKCRVLVAETPHTEQPAVPAAAVEHHEDLGLTLHAYGGTFAGASVDHGSRLLVGQFGAVPAGVRDAVDLGCGNGLLAAALAQARPDVRVTAIDESRAAVRSTSATMAANGLDDRVKVVLGDGLESVPNRSVDLVVSNPPFHRGTAKDTAVAYAMIEGAARTLRPGGELWMVYNSHLPYLRALRRVVGRTTVLVQNPRYTVTRSVCQV